MINISNEQIIKQKSEIPTVVDLVDKARIALSTGDKKKAISLYKKAASQGSIYAPNLLAELYFNDNSRINKKKIFQLMQLGALRGDIVAQKNVGIRLQDVEYVKKVDYMEAFKYLYSSAIQGNAEASIALAYLYVSFKIEKDEFEAAYWAEHALEDISDEATNLINHLTISSEEISEKADEYFYGSKDVKVNYDKAASLYHVASMMDNPYIYANAMLGYCYMFGKGRKIDLIKAKINFEVALANGNHSVQKYYDKLESEMKPYVWNDVIEVKKEIPATDEQMRMFNAGNAALRTKKYTDALDNFLKAAKLGYADAYTKLGYMFLNGQGASSNNTKAYKMFKEGADLGDPIAQYEVAKMIEQGLGCDKYDKQAFYYMYQAAMQGNPLSSRELCKYYRDGIGCNVDHLEAFYWLSKTYNSKDKESQELYESLDQIDSKEASIRGNIFYTGNGVDTDFNRAYSYYFAGAERSDNPNPICMYNCGLCYFYGRGTEKDVQAAYDYALASFEKGYKGAQQLIEKAVVELSKE